MGKTLDFKILEGTSLDEFEESVKKHLNEGWELHGSLLAFPDTKGKSGEIEGLRYIQAFIKNVADNKPLGFSVSR